MGWVKASKLKLNLDKTEVSVVGASHVKKVGRQLVLEDIGFTLKEQVHFLGVILNSKLTLEAQVASVINMAYAQQLDGLLAAYIPGPDQPGRCYSHPGNLLIRLLQCVLCGAALEDHPEASAGAKFS